MDDVVTPKTDHEIGEPLPGRRLHFVGVGGSGMSGLARLVRQRGAEVSGSDRGDTPGMAAVRAAGIDVTLEQTAAAVPAACDTLVVSAAIPGDHPEVVEARRRGVEVVKYAAMLGRLMGQSGTAGVAIAGTHGKSTTTAILCHVLLSAGLDPSFILGAHCAQIGGGSRAGGGSVSGEWGAVSGEETSSATRKDASPHSLTPTHHSPSPHLLIAEACEYDRSFHHLRPTHAVVLNVEADHLDIYDSLDAIVESFRDFARLLPDDGSLLIQHESPHRLAVTAGVSCKTETIGFASQADWRVRVEGQTVTLHHHGQAVCAWVQPMPGDHFAYNAAAAAVTAHRLGAPWEAIGPAVANFRGLDRRMQELGQRGAVTVVDDYGHHPTEIDTTLRALRNHHQPERLICVFQPHQHSRTRHLMEQFVVSFGAADVVVVPEIYFVRDSEQERQAVTAGALVDRLRAHGVSAMHLHPFDAIVEQLRVMARPGDLVVTMGAGDVWQIGRGFLEQS